MRRSRFGIIIGFLALFAPLHAHAAEAGFDCAKAKANVEKLICGDADLAGLDKDLAEKVSAVRDHYTGDLRDEFVKGQRTWLKLRNEACAVDTDDLNADEKTKCLASVYKERLTELGQQLELQKAGNLSHIDRVLDEKTHLSAYDPENMGSMYFAIDKFEFKKAYLPHSCREHYTLRAGQWSYSADTKGAASGTNADATCVFKIFSSQNRPDKATAAKVNFLDFSKYSEEFSCIGDMNASDAKNCTNQYSKQVSSFAKETNKGHIKIINAADAPPVSDTDSADQSDNGSMLIIDQEQQEFTVDGMNYRIMAILRGNFTGHRRQEALLKVLEWPYPSGTFRNFELLLAYYDPASDSIRPLRIDLNSPFILKLRKDPSPP